MSWEKMKERSENKNFIKLKDGEEVQGVFAGEPYTFYKKFKDQVEYADWADGRSWKFRINFIVKGDNGYEAKVLEGGSTICDQILAAKEEEGLDAIYKIKRKGSGKEDTVYTVHFKGKLTPEQIEQMKGVKLQNLVFNRSTSLNAPPPDDDSVPF